MPKPTQKHRSQAGVLADVKLRRCAKQYAAASRLPRADKRRQRAWMRLLGAAFDALRARIAEVGR